MMEWEVASQIATVVGAVGLIGVFVQVFLASKSIRADHERSRREKAVDLLLQWTATLQKDNSRARRIVESLTEEQCRTLFRGNRIRVSREHEVILRDLFSNSGQFESEDENTITLTTTQAAELRWQVLSYLNSLEAVLVAWQYSVADNEIIEHQFSYLVDPEEGQYALKEFRTAAGGEESFPAIALFEQRMNEKQGGKLKDKGRVA